VNATHQLNKLHKAATNRIAKLRSLVSHYSGPVTAEKDRVISWAVIDALNLWSGFLRAYYLSGAITTKNKQGARIVFTSRKFPSAEAAMRFAIVMKKKPAFTGPISSRRDEPSWHDAGILVDLLNKLKVSNLSQVRAAFSTSSGFIAELAVLRNFYAHRCDETSRKAARVGVRLGLTATPRLRASEIMCSRLPARPQNVITDWLDDMKNVIDVLCS
jgi:hypothetical protein